MVLPLGLCPMLATPGRLPPGEDRWAHEVKWDGVRALVAIQAGQARLTSRNGRDVTASYPELGSVAARTHDALVDGEIVAFDERGVPDFGLLQSRMHVGHPSDRLRTVTPVMLLAFDVLHVDGQSLLDEPYDLRREVLTELGLTGRCEVPAAFLGDGEALLASTAAQGLEGVVSKRRDSRYEPGRRSNGWVKVKHVQRQSAVVIGWQPGEGGRSGRLGSLLLAVPGPPRLTYAGHVGTGFTARTLQQLAGALAPLATDRPACEVPREYARLARWVRPELVAEVEFTAWTRDGRLRHPSYKGLRPDLQPEQVVRE